MTTAARLSGPPAIFRPKDPRPVTVNLTTEGRDLLENTARALQVSRADLVEFLLRRFAARVYVADGQLHAQERP